MKELYNSKKLTWKDVVFIRLLANFWGDKYNVEDYRLFINKRSELLTKYGIADSIETIHVIASKLYCIHPNIGLEDKLEVELQAHEIGLFAKLYTTDYVDDLYFTKAYDTFPDTSWISLQKLIRLYMADKYLSGIWDLFRTKEDIDAGYDTCSSTYNVETEIYVNDEKREFFKNITKNFASILQQGTVSFKMERGDFVKTKCYLSEKGISACQILYNRCSIGSDFKLSFSNSFAETIYITFDRSILYVASHRNSVYPISLKKMEVLYQYPFFASIFDKYMEMLINEGYYVWKDIHALLKNGSPLPPVPINKMKYCRTKKEMMLSYYKHADFYNWNRGNLYVGYIAMKAMTCLCEIDKNILIDYINKNPDLDDKCVSVVSLLCDVLISHISVYDKENFDGYDRYDFQQIFKNYMSMSKQMHRKISLRFCSLNSLFEAHDDLAHLFQEKNTVYLKIPKNSKFNGLRKMLPREFEWITSRARLVKEGKMMNHCVASYAPYINADICAIYSFVYKKERYTIEFACKGQSKYEIVQVQKAYNRGCSQEVKDYILSFLQNDSQSS